jgi:hypothetical protein
MNLDNILVKAKEVFETAYKKADDVVTVQKQKFDVSSLENKLCKDYEELGKLCYAQMQNGAFNDNTEFKNIFDEIQSKNAQIEEMKKEILKAKNKKRCPSCDAAIDKNSAYCNVCGAKFTEGTE